MDDGVFARIPVMAGPSQSLSRAGQLLFVGFDGVEMSGDLAAFFRKVRPGGIILFRRNIVDAGQTRRLISDLCALWDPPPVLAVDEEGGRVSRLDHMAPSLPPAAELSRRADPGRVKDLAQAQGRILRGLGFHLDFSPVVDLSAPDATNGIGDRSFGRDAELVCRMARAYLDGLAESGMLGCLKHFPGLGPSTCDSHLELPSVQKNEEEFMLEDLLPYRRLHSRVAAVMVGHGHYPFLAGKEAVAATLVPRIASRLLRDEIGFRGLSIADDLEMKAVSDRFPYRDLAVRVVEAGCDMALVCHGRDAILESLGGLHASIETGRLAASRIEEALSRIAALRDSLPGEAPASLESFHLACADLQALLEITG